MRARELEKELERQNIVKSTFMDMYLIKYDLV